jgi:hypothetical protein
MKKLSTFLVLTSLLFLTTVSISAQRRQDAGRSALKPRTGAELSRSEAFSDGNGVYIKWTTASESKNLGFNVYRVEGGEIVPVNKNLILSERLRMPDQQVSGGEYSFFDASGDFSGQYFIESVSLSGQRKTFSLIFPQYIADLTPVAGANSEFLQAAKAASEPNIIKSEPVAPEDLRGDIKSVESDSTTQRWVASQPGIKIGVRQEGVYRVTRAQMEAAGFDVNSSPNLWQLYKNGIEQSIIVAPNGEYIEFYGVGLDTYETDTQNYFLVVGASGGKRMAARTARTTGGSVVAQSYVQTFEKKERTTYSPNIFNGEGENFFGTLILNTCSTPTTCPTVTFNLSGIETAENVSVKLTIQGLTNSAHDTRVVLNDTELGNITGLGRASMVRTFNVPSSLLKEGVNTLRLTSQSANDISFFDNIQVTYPRRYLAKSNELSFYTNNYRISNLTGFASSNIRVFDITSSDSPVQLTNLNIRQDGSTFGVKLPAHRSRLMYAVSDEAVKQPASITQNVPSTLSNAANSADLLIITHKNFSAQANDWASYRAGQGAVVKIVDIEDVFDEFNFGNSASLAIRSFLSFAKNNWQNAPDYVLLIGDASYDPRNYEGRGNWNLVPTKMVDTLYSETGSDDSLADFNNDGLAEIPIGRIPARTTDNVNLALTKVKNFEQSVGQAINRGALCVSDLPEGYDFIALCERVFGELAPGVNKSYINRADTDAHNKIITSLNAGKYIVNYSGHGTVTSWSSSSSFFSASHANQLTNSNLTIFTMLTCLNGYFIDRNNSFSESALFAPGGGAVTVWASSGLTTPDVQEIMAKRFYKNLSDGTITRMGDLVNDAKTVISSGTDVRLSWALLGDPMLKVR